MSVETKPYKYNFFPSTQNVLEDLFP